MQVIIVITIISKPARMAHSLARGSSNRMVSPRGGRRAGWRPS
jgi:hypothetical protein